ncbi:response regulator [Rariglobus hedericola]|uniref:histidine kinase n=1 Tax=Rariglobus hedericola TaxID=2597822 RepID=A0A556QPM3_9BACT|nr:response regulator [Rariglobus hedericola]TSJ78594.1 response regulator [Rariglobus hedericola]
MSNTQVDSLPSPHRIALLTTDNALIGRLQASGLVPNLIVVSSVAAMDTAIQTLKPDAIFLTALSDSESLTYLIRTLHPRLSRRRIVALSHSDDSEDVVACLRCGADDFFSLRDPSQFLLRLERILNNLRSGTPRRSMDTRFKTLADSAPALVWITDETGSFIHFNRPWLEFTGRSFDTEINHGWFQGLPAEDRDRFRKAFGDCFQKRDPFRLDFRLRRHDGLYRWITCQGIPHYEEDGVFTGYIGSGLDVSDQHEAETLLAYRAITQAALAGFGRYALSQHTIQEIKQEATRLLCDTLQLDYSEVLLFDPMDSDQLVPMFTSGLPNGFQHGPMTAGEARISGDNHLRLDDDAGIFPGRENHAALNVRSALAAPINNGVRIVGFLTGLSTEQRSFGREAFDVLQALVTTISTVHQRNLAELALQESETKLLQSQKMEAVGQLAGGVAHDFNNLLTAVRCYGDMLHDELTEIAPQLKARTSEILKATARASSLTRQLLAFSRKQVLQPEVLDMNGVIADLRDLVRSLLSENVTLDVTFLPEDSCFEADRNQIDQVVLNLCLNARDAMPQNGVLSLIIQGLEVTGANTHQLAPGNYVQLTVRDTGIGMDATVKSQLFQPFFTTKPVGRGTGLGLATCAVIVKNCNGFITFESAPGKGTSFHLFLPRIDSARAQFFLESEQYTLTGKERLLIVEDDEAIRHITQAILESLGYKVTVLNGSVEALKFYQDNPDSVFDLLLSDVIMPEMNGLELARHIQAHFQPGLRPMFMSGYLGDTATVQAVADYNLPFLEKPFTMDSLARKVRETLDSPPVSLPLEG